MSAEPRSEPLGRRILAGMALVVFVLSVPEASVLESDRPPTRGDVMYMLHAPRVPEETKTVALMVQQAPAHLDLANQPRAPSEPKNAPVPAQTKGALFDERANRHRSCGRRSRRRRRRSK